jgi:hypothetical protein
MGLKMGTPSGIILPMTVIADNKKRVTLPTAKPGDRFDIQISGEGFLLRKLEPVESRPAKVRFEKRGKYTVGVLDRPIDEKVIKELVAEFP